MKFIQWIKWFIEQMVGVGGTVRFGVVISAAFVVYFCTMDAIYFFKHAHTFIDNSTLLTQLGVMTAFYGVNKAHDAVTSTNSNA